MTAFVFEEGGVEDGRLDANHYLLLCNEPSQFGGKRPIFRTGVEKSAKPTLINTKAKQH